MVGAHHGRRQPGARWGADGLRADNNPTVQNRRGPARPRRFHRTGGVGIAAPTVASGRPRGAARAPDDGPHRLPADRSTARARGHRAAPAAPADVRRTVIARPNSYVGLVSTR